MLNATATYRGVRISVYLRDGKAIASLVKGSLVEHHVIEYRTLTAHTLTNDQAIELAKGLLK